jgi:site-specific recombinase XerC
MGNDDRSLVVKCEGKSLLRRHRSLYQVTIKMNKKDDASLFISFKILFCLQRRNMQQTVKQCGNCNECNVHVLPVYEKHDALFSPHGDMVIKTSLQ